MQFGSVFVPLCIFLDLCTPSHIMFYRGKLCTLFAFSAHGEKMDQREARFLYSALKWSVRWLQAFYFRNDYLRVQGHQDKINRSFWVCWDIVCAFLRAHSSQLWIHVTQIFTSSSLRPSSSCFLSHHQPSPGLCVGKGDPPSFQKTIKVIFLLSRIFAKMH